MGRRKEAVKSAKLDLTRKIMLRAGEAAQLLGVHTNTVRRWSDQGILRAYLISTRGDRRFRRTELESFLRQRKRT
jgi:excisionase family DNA binding protein